MTNVLAAPRLRDDADPEAWREVQQLYGLLTGQRDWGAPISHTSFDDDGVFAHTIRNLGLGGHLNVETSGGDSVLSVTDGGVNAGAVSATTLTVALGTELHGDVTLGDDPDQTITINGTLGVQAPATFADTVDVVGPATFADTVDITGAATFADTVTVTGAATFNAAVTLGDAAGDVITVNGTPTFNAPVTFTSNVIIGDAAADTLTVNSTTLLKNNVTIGDTNADTLTVIGLTRYRNAANTLVQMYVDAANNRVQVGSATPLSAATTSILEVTGNRSYFAPNSEVFAVGLRYGAAVLGQVWLGASNSATPDLVVSNTAGVQLARAFNGGGLLVGTNAALAGSQQLEVQTGGARITAGGLYVAAGGVGIGGAPTSNQLYINGSGWLRVDNSANWTTSATAGGIAIPSAAGFLKVNLGGTPVVIPYCLA